MAATRVLIVDDSALARALIRDMLEDAPDIEIVGEAANGLEAVEKAEALRPQLITMDLEMPVMGGMEAIETIMHSNAVPILVVSSQADSTNAYEAVSRGALDVVPKPDVNPETARAFIDKVRLLAGIRVIKHLRPPPRRPAPASPVVPSPQPTAAPATAAPAASQGSVEIVVIASSTGGPQALAEILQHLPANLAAPVVIAQHLSDGFAEDMARWLNGLSPLQITVATDGELLQPGHVYIAPPEQRLLIGPNRRVRLQPRESGDIYKPSCDHLLESAAAVFGRHCLGVILTGMGRDGVRGMQSLHACGAKTLAQDEGSSVVYGMNALAVQSGVVQEVLPLSEMAARIAKHTGIREAH